MNLNEAKRAYLKRKKKKRVGRGTGSGLGKTCGKGANGQNSRSGGGTRLGFEGGQMPLIRRLPKKGFNNPNRTEYHIINVGMLNDLEDGTTLDPPKARSLGLVKGGVKKIKILGKGELTKKLIVGAHRFSNQAREKIQKAGGEVREI